MLVPVRASPVPKERKQTTQGRKERKRTTQGRDGRTARRHHTGILRRGVWCASRRPPLGVRLFLSLFAVSRRFSLRPSCHLAVVPLSSFFPLSLLLLSRRSPLLRSAAPPPPAGPLLSRLLAPFGAAPPSSLQRHEKERKKTDNPRRDGRTARRHHTGILRRGVWCAIRRPP